jgi:O-antigen/teichoic acid export membrane protein
MLLIIKTVAVVLALSLLVPLSVFVMSGGSWRQAWESMREYAVCMAILYVPGLILVGMAHLLAL